MESAPCDSPTVDNPKSNSEKENKINNDKNLKYPFNGKALNLIDKFLIFAYDQKTKEYTIDNFLDDSIRETIETRFCFCQFQERPNIINEICNDYHKDLLDNDLILELLFPNIPKMYYLRKSEANLKKEESDDILTQTSIIIFSLNPQDNLGSKKSYNGLGYTFYLNQEYKDSKTGEIKGYMFYPVTYCILSEYPFFMKFTNICKNINNQLRKETDQIPIDIILYNTVKFLPSPIKSGIKLNFGASFNSINTLQTSSVKNIFNRYQNDYFSLRKSNTMKDESIPTIKFPQLSGYPLMDINISFIFNLLPPEIIIEVFIFTFLEHDIIFYSTRPEVLNMVIFIFSNLNYPFNDSIYYWHVLSVSLNSFMTGSSKLVGKTSSTLTGILNEYQPDVITTKKIHEHFVLDIDNKNFFFLYSEENEDVKKTMILHNYIKTCSSFLEEKNIVEKDKTKLKNNEKDFEDGVGLYAAIVDLQEELTRRSKKVTSTNYNDKKNKPSFLRTYEDEDEEECLEANLRLQKAFFIFITQILQKYVQILEVNSGGDDYDDRSSSTSNFKINIKKEQNQNDEDFQRKKLAIQAGKIFKTKFKECSKYSSFVISFIQYHESIDLYKIPYTFISEFIYYSHVAEKNNLSEVDVFKLIDKFYGKEKRLTLDEEIKNIKNKGKKNNLDKKKDKIENNFTLNYENEEENYILFSFDIFAKYYMTNLKNYMVREQEDDKESFYRVKKPTKNKFFGRKGFTLSNKILIKYANYLNNIDNPMKEFHFLEGPESYEYLNNYQDENDDKEKFFDNYDLVEITEVVERHFIMERCFTSYGLIKFSLLNVLAITRTFYKGNYIKSREDIKKMCRFCKQTKSLVRKYMFIYLNIFNTLKKQNLLEENICDECTKVITNYFDEANMIPTEAISKTLSDITSKSSNTSSIKNKKINKSIKMDPFEEGGACIGGVMKNDYFYTDKKKTNKKGFNEILSLIETIFNGNFKKFQYVEDHKDLKFFEENYNFIKSSLIKKLPEGKDKKEKEKEINKKNFDLKTPLALYRDSYNALNLFLKKYDIEEIDLVDLYCNILSLIYYFKIPIIEEKWIETLINHDNNKSQLKDRIIEKMRDKKKDKDKHGEDGTVKNKNIDINLDDLKENTIPDIIEMLTELFGQVKNYLIKIKKINK